MRDLYKTIAHLEHTLTRGLRAKASSSAPLPPPLQPKPSIRAWHAPATHAAADETRYPAERYSAERVFKPSSLTVEDKVKDEPMTQLTLTARALKVTVPLDPAELAALPVRGGQARSQLAVTCEGKVYTADIATKSLHKAKATIAASSVANVFAMVQGKLKGNEIAEAGLVAQVKTPKPTATG
jgi:hypothetical protein